MYEYNNNLCVIETLDLWLLKHYALNFISQGVSAFLVVVGEQAEISRFKTEFMSVAHDSPVSETNIIVLYIYLLRELKVKNTIE